MAIHEASRVEHAKAVAFECGLLRGRVPRHSKEVEDRIDGFHGRSAGITYPVIGSQSDAFLRLIRHLVSGEREIHSADRDQAHCRSSDEVR